MGTLTKEQISHLKKMLKSSKNTVYCTLNRVSASGMTRHITFLVAYQGRIVKINWYLARLLGYKIDRNTGGLVVRGCGMDMGFHVVYSMGRALTSSRSKKDAGYTYNNYWI